MNRGSQRITHWEGLATEAGYNASRLAKFSGVSLRQLERVFREVGQGCPKVWLEKLRDRRAIELLKESLRVKEVAHILGYRNPNHFSRDFKERHGLSPSQFARSRADMSRFDI